MDYHSFNNCSGLETRSEWLKLIADKNKTITFYGPQFILFVVINVCLCSWMETKMLYFHLVTSSTGHVLLIASGITKGYPFCW